MRKREGTVNTVKNSLRPFPHVSVYRGVLII